MTLALLVALQGPIKWGDSLEAAVGKGRPVVAYFRAEPERAPARDPAFRDPKLYERLLAFECVVVASARAIDAAGARPPEVRLYNAKGETLSRLLLASAEAKVDPRRIEAELAWALEELKRPEPREIALPVEGRELIGTKAPAWRPDGWIGEAPELDGRVTLVRWFTDSCPYCAASMPAFQELHDRHRERGLVVVGFYHPKPFGADRPRPQVERMLDAWGIKFPVGLDTRWETLSEAWLKGATRSATSVSLLVDRKGVIRWIHPGMEIHPSTEAAHAECERRFRELEAALRVVLAEPVSR